MEAQPVRCRDPLPLLIHPMLKLIPPGFQRSALGSGGVVGLDELGLAQHLPFQQVQMLQELALQLTPRLPHTSQFSLLVR